MTKFVASATPLTALAVVLFLATGTVQAADIQVVFGGDSDCSDGMCDFQAALDVAATNDADDVLTLPSTRALVGGAFKTTVPFVYESDLGFDLEIVGAGASETVLSGDSTSSVLTIRSRGGTRAEPVAIRVADLAVRNGTDSLGHPASLSVLTNFADVTLESTEFAGNAGAGGSVRLNADLFGGGSATILNSSFHDNESPALLVIFPAVTVSGSVFEDNRGCGSAKIVSRLGPVVVNDNWFNRNASEPDVTCEGAGLHLTASGIFETEIFSNQFRHNEAGDGSSGTGAYVSRTDGAVRLERNVFFENVIAGISEDGVGAGLWLSLAGSFAEGKVLGNVFLNNNARRIGNAAWIYSLDTPVLFASNTVSFNRPNDSYNPNSAAVRFDAPGIDVRANIFWQNAFVGGDDVLLVDRANLAEQATFVQNRITDFAVPPGTDLDDVFNHDDDPLLADYPDYHIADASSPAVDAALEYTGFPDVDIDGEDRRIDGNDDGLVFMDQGADEFGGFATLSPSEHLFVVEETADGASFDNVQFFTLTNVGADDLDLQDRRFATPSSDWVLAFGPQTLAPGASVRLGVNFTGDGRRDRRNTLILETSAGTLQAALIGDFQAQPFSDTDGVSDRMESGPGGRLPDWDGNCDGVPDREQNNVVSLRTRGPDGQYLTLVAPRIDQQIGTGDFFSSPLEPVFSDMRPLTTLDEVNAGPSGGRDYPYGFFSFRLTAIGAIGTNYAVSIILPKDGVRVDGYVKNGPTPADGWYRNRPPGGGWRIRFPHGPQFLAGRP